jgi:hypothetical protein
LSNEPIADLIASRLPNLVHPGDEQTKAFCIPLPMFRAAAAIPPEQAEQFAAAANLPTADVAKLTAEAVVSLIETEGASEIVPKTELAELRTIADTTEPPKHRQPRVCCNVCGKPLFRINVDTENPKVAGKQFLEALATLDPDCPHTPKAAS